MNQINIIMISAACCVPGMAAFDKQAQTIIEKAISETGIDAYLKIIPATTAVFGGVTRKVILELMAGSGQNKVIPPVIMIGDEVVSYGVPALQTMKEALYKFAGVKIEDKDWFLWKGK